MDLPLYLDVPFIGLLLSIALIPLLSPKFWHQHYGKVSLFWSILCLAGLLCTGGVEFTSSQVAHTLFEEYLPFLILLISLYVISGGILITGDVRGSPAWNTGVLALGSCAASIVGTTGASMILIRPLIRANIGRLHNAHVIVFFILTVSNIGGSLSPLGDPPLFLGFLQGVNFFWTTTHLLPHTTLMLGVLLLVFYFIDCFVYKLDNVYINLEPNGNRSIGIVGKANLVLLAVVVGSVLMSGLWDPQITYSVFGAKLSLQGIVRDVLLLIASLISLVITDANIRRKNGFTSEPMKEVAKLFCGIFITIIPILHQLREGPNGIFGPLISLTRDPSTGQFVDAIFFWLTGILSSFLDNAPTYLVFFNIAGGDPVLLQTQMASTLAAISAGAVFMGANTYIGNAPNFMVKAIAEEQGIAMPSFFGYMAWSFGILTPLFILLTFVFF